MAIPSRQIGWDTRDNLLWQISKQLEHLICVKSGGCTTTTTTTAIPCYNFQVQCTGGRAFINYINCLGETATTGVNSPSPWTINICAREITTALGPPRFIVTNLGICL